MFPFYALNKLKIFLRIPLLNKYLLRVLRRNTRLYMRGYEKAKKNPGLNYFNELYIDLCETNIDCNSNLEEFLNKTNINLKYSLRQSVISKLLNCNKHSLQRVFFKAFEDCRPIVFSLPFEYIIKIELNFLISYKQIFLHLYKMFLLFLYLNLLCFYLNFYIFPKYYLGL